MKKENARGAHFKGVTRSPVLQGGLCRQSGTGMTWPVKRMRVAQKVSDPVNNKSEKV
jgi:hypothetical protein